jgi:lysophospholipase L1-like esterase
MTSSLRFTTPLHWATSIALMLTLLAACGSAAAQPAAKSAHRPGSTFLVLGDSYSTGYQPAGGGDRTCSNPVVDATGHGGWACLVLAKLRTVRPGIAITNLASNGEDTCSFAVIAHCGGLPRGFNTPAQSPVAGSQWARALAVLRAHPNGVSPITIEIGGNDLLGSLGTAPISATRVRLDRIMRSLRSAAPKADIIMFGVFSPIGQPLGITTQLNTVFKAEARAVHALFVGLDVHFRGRAAQLVNPNDVHPTDAGQRLIAKLIWRSYRKAIGQ